MHTSARVQASAHIPTAANRSRPTGMNADSLSQSMDLMGATMAYPRNCEIFGEGEPADYLYKVISGSVRTYKITRDGRRQVAGFYMPGDIFGWNSPMSTHCQRKRSAMLKCWSSSAPR